MITAKRLTVLGILLLFGAIIVSCHNGADKNGDIKIGAALPLTGSGAVWGENARNGMELAKDELNASGGINGRNLDIIYEDTQGLPQVGVRVIEKLISADGVEAVIGCITSSTTLAMAPIAAKNEVVLFSPGASNPQLSEAGPYFFRNFPSDAIEAPEIAKMVFNKLGVKRAAILYVNNEFGKGHEYSFTAQFKELGGKIVDTEAFPQEGGDFRTQITKLKQHEFGVLYLPGYPKEMSTVLRQLAEAGITAQIVCPSALIDDELIEDAGELVNGIIFADQRPADKSLSSVAHFLRAYRERYGEEPGIVCDTSYDAVKLIAKAIETSSNSGSEIKKALDSVSEFPGAIGLTTFNEDGEIIKAPVFKRVESGKIVEYWSNPS
jgi:branched-chain amino acid transport system substrate-binding protein